MNQPVSSSMSQRHRVSRGNLGQGGQFETSANSQARALDRKQALELQQRTFQPSYPSPHLFRNRPPS